MKTKTRRIYRALMTIVFAIAICYSFSIMSRLFGYLGIASISPTEKVIERPLTSSCQGAIILLLFIQYILFSGIICSFVSMVKKNGIKSYNYSTPISGAVDAAVDSSVEGLVDSLVKGLAIGLTFVVPMGLIFSLTGGGFIALVGLLIFGMLFGLLFGLLGGSEEPKKQYINPYVELARIFPLSAHHIIPEVD